MSEVHSPVVDSAEAATAVSTAPTTTPAVDHPVAAVPSTEAAPVTTSTTETAKPTAEATPTTAEAKPLAAAETAAAKETVEPAERKGRTSFFSNLGTKAVKTAKSRSVSRKRGSIFGALLNKKETAEEKKEVSTGEAVVAKGEAKPAVELENKTLTSEAPALTTVPGVVTTTEGEATKVIAAGKAEVEGLAAPVIDTPLAAVDKITTDASTAATTTVSDALAPAVPAKEASKSAVTGATRPGVSGTGSVGGTPKSGKRMSFFGTLLNKAHGASPTAEKKEREAAPVVPPKDASGAAIPAVTEPAATSGETVPAVAAEPSVTPAAEPTAAATAVAPIADAETKAEETKVVEKKEVEAAAATTPVSSSPSSKDRRRSFFSGLSSKKVKNGVTDAETAEGEHKPTLPKLGSLFRKPSRAPKDVAVPATAAAEKSIAAPETAAAKEATSEAPAATKAETAAPAAQHTPATESDVKDGAIGDVVPDAVTIGEAPVEHAAVTQAKVVEASA